MSLLLMFKGTLVNALCGSIADNLDKYYRDDSWVAEVYSASSRDIQTSVAVAEKIYLDSPEDGNLKDIENAIRLHKALRHLTPLQASDPRIWTRLTHVEFWPYMRARWPVERHVSNYSRAVRFIESRYFVTQRQSRALLRNGVARLWWTAQLSYDSDRDNPYELTNVLLSTLDITQQIVERGMGRANNIIKGFLEFLLQNKETLLTGGDKNRARIRHLAKYINMYGGICVLDLLSQSDVIDLLNKELTRILEAEATERKEKTVE